MNEWDTFNTHRFFFAWNPFKCIPFKIKTKVYFQSGTFIEVYYELAHWITKKYQKLVIGIWIHDTQYKVNMDTLCSIYDNIVCSKRKDNLQNLHWLFVKVEQKFKESSGLD